MYLIAPSEFLMALRMYNSGLPEGALTAWGKAEEMVARAGSAAYPRTRMWVDVTEEGVAFLESCDYYLRTLVASVRLHSTPRGRHQSNNS